MKRAMTMAALTVATALAVAACGSDDGGMAGMDMSTSATSAAGDSGSDEDAEHNDADVMFAQMMIPHHAQAIEMSDVVLAKDGVDEQVAALAQQIKDAQQPEIEQMTGWLEGWGAEVPDTSMGSMGDMDHGRMGGMMSEEDMQALESADGPAASRLFLEQMIEHHRGAIEMAEAEVADGQDPAAVELATTIITDQQAEIAQMEELLAQL